MAWFEYNMTREDVLEEHPNATEEQIQATIDYWNDPKRYAAGIARSAGQGITFGYGDELTAFIKSRFGKNSYEELVEHEREELEKFRKENPELAYGTELLAGAIIPGAGLARGGLPAGRLLGRGATAGAIYGSGAAEGDVTTIPGAISRATGATIGAAGGAAGSYLFPKAAGLAYKGVEAARKQLRGGDRLSRVEPSMETTGLSGEGPILAGMSQKEISQSATALNNRIWAAIEDNPALKQKIEASGLTPLEYFRKNMDDRSMVADIPGISRYLRGVVQGSGRAGERADRILGARREGEFEALMAEVERLMGVGISRNADATMDTFITALEKQASPLYRQAYTRPGLRGVRVKNTIASDQFKEIMARDPDLFEEAYKAVAKDMRRRGRKVPSWKEWREQEGFDVETLHQIKRFFDGKIQYVKEGVEPTIKPKGGEALAKLKDDFNNVILANNKLYAEANKIWSETLRLPTVLKAGRKAIGQTKFEVQDAFSKLKTDRERAVFRSAIIESLVKKSGDGQRNISSIVTSGTGKEGNRVRQALEATFPNRKAFVQFMQKVNREQEYRTTETRIGTERGSAPTGVDIQQSGKIRMGDLGATAARAAMNPLFAVGETARKIGNTAAALKDERLRRGVAELAFNRNSQERDAALSILMRQAVDPNDQKILFMIKSMLGGAATPATQAGPGLLGIEEIAQPSRLLM